METTNSIINRVKSIILTPKKEWEVIAAEESTAASVLMGYLLPLVIIVAIANFIGYSIVGMNSPLGRIVGFGWGIRYAILTFANYIVGTFLTAYVISFLAPSFNGEKNYRKAFKLVVYSYTPILVAGLLFIIPALGTLVLIAALYSFYILYLGLGLMTGVPKEKQTTFLIVSVVALILVYALVSLVFTKIII